MSSSAPSSGGDARPVPDAPRNLSVRAVLFDFDGTLTQQGAIDFAAIRASVSVPDDMFILEHLDRLSGAERADSLALVERHELEAAERSHPNDGAEAAVEALQGLGLPLGIVTRNGRAAVVRSLENFPGLTPESFDVIVTRDDGLPTKPAPDQLLAACARIRVEPEHAMMVGDFRLDVESGRAAGAITAYLYDRANDGQHPADGCDLVLDSLRELPDHVRRLLSSA